MKKILLSGFLFYNALLFAQEQSFKIQFKNTEETIRMICLENCKWYELEYKTNDFSFPKYFNEEGETNSNSSYIFSIEKAEEDFFVIKGSNNTQWESYRFKTKGFWKNFLLTEQGLQSL